MSAHDDNRLCRPPWRVRGQAGANGSPSRVWHNLRGLAMARSIGDHAAASVGVIAEPEITEYHIVEDDFAVVIASDGVWELLSSQQVADLVHSVESGDVDEIVEVIAEQVRSCSRPPCDHARTASPPLCRWRMRHSGPPVHSRTISYDCARPTTMPHARWRGAVILHVAD